MYLCIEQHQTPTATTIQLWRQHGPRELHFFLHLRTGTRADVEKVLELDFVKEKNRVYPFCYVLPLLPGMRHAHVTYCQNAQGSRFEATKTACLAFGILSLPKWLQSINGRDYVLYYQESREPIAAARQNFLDPQALAATLLLREQTGVSFSDLFPLSERL